MTDLELLKLRIKTIAEELEAMAQQSDELQAFTNKGSNFEASLKQRAHCYHFVSGWLLEVVRN